MTQPDKNSSQFILTFVAANNDLHETQFNITGDYLRAEWLCESKAAQIHMIHQPTMAAVNYIRSQLAAQKIDVFLTSAGHQRKKLLLADMDSTIVTSETLDDLAAFAGIKEQVAAITARAMNGEIDFHAALTERVGLLANLPADTMEKTYAETQLTSGALTFISTMKSHGATCILVSGGFTFFTEKIAEKCGFHVHHGNNLDIKDNKLTGRVIAPILDKNSKLTFLHRYCEQLNISIEDTLTIGDGANDLPMLQAAGLGLGFHAKPAVAEQITNTILYNDLTAALYAQGYSEKEFIHP
jgi:phosphoserine phosphatase